MGAVRFSTGLLFVGILLAACGVRSGTSAGLRPEACVILGSWTVPQADGAATRPPDKVLAGFAQQQVVLLGETHDDPEHHRWQLHTIAGLHALRPDLVLGFEMFPRRVQGVLDRWVAGELSETEFVSQSEWERVWGYDRSLYLPIFQFARMHRIPMLALNVERGLVSRVGDEGWAAIPAGEREGVSDPAPADRAYAIRLYQAYLDHQGSAATARQIPRERPSEEELADAKFRRFVEAMQVWDRAMAQGIAQRLRSNARPLVVAIVGTGHLRDGYGVPRQLRDLGVTRVAVALPWDPSDDCLELRPGLADAVFGIEARPRPIAADRPRLGISVEQAPDGVLVREVVPGSIAAQSDVRDGDLIVGIAGERASTVATVIDAVRRQAPGTWLPLTIRRGPDTVEIIARFPPRP